MKLSELMNLKENVTVGYLGGSITEADEYRDVVNSYPQDLVWSIQRMLGNTYLNI